MLHAGVAAHHRLDGFAHNNPAILILME